MRKYFKPRNVRKRVAATVIGKTVDPWFLLRLFAEEASGDLGLDITARLISCSEKQSVSQYLTLCRDLDSLTQSYDGSESLRTVRAHRQALALLKKYPFSVSDLEIGPRRKATEKWLQSEAQCRDTNLRLRAARREDLPQWVPLARRLIDDVLGDLTPSLIMNMICDRSKHGPGSTLTSNGDRTSAYYKFADLPYSVSGTARVYAYAAISSDPKWLDYLESSGRRTELPPSGSPRFQKELMLLDDCVVVKDSDRVTFVPKDASTDRPIAVGANLNLFLQLGVKSYMEDRLKVFGVDLTDQTKNQKFALLGSRYWSIGSTPNTNQFSTIDLASASDTISLELVRLLLPPYWFAFLDDLRHKTGTLEGETVTYEKFSAMGNGFTFPLESLIFWAIAKSACEVNGFNCSPNDITVFGDDIIVRQHAAGHVISALSWAGFSLNLEKSFISSPFKESCGKDYYKGALVRPFYLKRVIRTYQDIYFVCNSLADISQSSNSYSFMSRIYVYLIGLIPVHLRTYGPLEFSELYLSVPFSYVSGKGLRPYLSEAERNALVTSNLLASENHGLQCCYVASEVLSAIPFRARQSVNYMLSLRSIPLNHPEMEWFSKIFDLEVGASDSRTTYRRKAVKYTHKIRPVLNWDGESSYRDRLKHLSVLI